MIREYQDDCVNAISGQLQGGVDSTLAVLATGLGKTTIAAEFIRRVQPARSLFFAHRDTLIFQARDTIEAFAGVKCGIEMAELSADPGLFSKDQVVIGTVQTQYSGNEGLGRMMLFRPEDFDYLFLDECFPAGTLVDGIPIENLRVGHKVLSVGAAIEPKRVVKTFKKKPTQLLRVAFASGHQMVVTPNHPVFSVDCGDYMPAGALTVNSVVFRLITNEPEMLRMWRKSNPQNKIRALSSLVWKETVLFPLLRARNALKGVVIDYGSNKSKIRIPEDDLPQPYVPPDCSEENVGHPAPNWPQTYFSGWQWERSDEHRGGVVRRVILENQCQSEDEYAKKFGLSRLLQTGRWPTSIKDRSGDRWSFTFCGDQEATGQKEGRFFTVDRVESVEVLEPGSDGKFGGLCPDGFVYNIEVEDNHNYFADDVLVHNCHHWVAPSFKKVVDYYRRNPRLKIIGFTATPDRSDREALGQIFQTTAYEYDIEDGILDGWLVPPDQQFVAVQGLDYSHISTTAGDLNLGQLSAVMEEEETVQRMIQPTLEAAWGLEVKTLDYFPVEDWGHVLPKRGRPRCTLVFCTSVKQAQRFAEVMNRVRSGMATAIWDKVPKTERKTIFEDFRSGLLQCLVNVGICGEGFDNPNVEVLVMGRATKSRSLYTQFVGRGLRPLRDIVKQLNNFMLAADRVKCIQGSAKPSVRVLDFVGNSGTHKLVSLADILGGKITDKAREMAKKKAMKSDSPINMSNLLEESEEEVRRRIEKAKKLAEERRIKLVFRSDYKTIQVDPFDSMDILPAKPKAFGMNKKLSEGQLAFMRKFGINGAQYPYAQGIQLFVELKQRLDKRLATPGQCELLKKHGYLETKNLPAKEAKKMIDQLKSNNWRRPSPIADDVY